MATSRSAIYRLVIPALPLIADAGGASVRFPGLRRETVFQTHALPRGAMVSRGREIDPAAITETALMTVEGELDDISGIGQTRAAHDLCVNIPGHRKRHWEQPGVGHYGIFTGQRWREQILPRVRDFLRDFG